MSASKLKPLNEFNVEDSPYKVFEKLVNADFYAPPSNALIQPNKMFHLEENYDCPNPDLKNFAYPTVKIGDLAFALLVPDRLFSRRVRTFFNHGFGIAQLTKKWFIYQTLTLTPRN